MDQNDKIKLINEIDANSEAVFNEYVNGIEKARDVVATKKNSHEVIHYKQLALDESALMRAEQDVIDMRAKFIRLKERYKYSNLEEMLKIVNDWYEFISVVTPIHLKSADLITSNSDVSRQFTLSEQDQLIKLEEIKKRFDAWLS